MVEKYFNERFLRDQIRRCLNKDFDFGVFDEGSSSGSGVKSAQYLIFVIKRAYEENIKYDINSMRNDILKFLVDDVIYKSKEQREDIIKEFVNLKLKNGYPEYSSYDSDIYYSRKSMEIKKVIFNGPATIVIWDDGSKTVVKCQENDIYDEEKGLLLCIAKKMYGGKLWDIIDNWIPEETAETKELIKIMDFLEYIFGE